MSQGELVDTAPRLTRKGQATRERIVAAAARLMFERGVAGTSTDDVQHAAGVSTSQIYHYFSDKRTLVRAVIAHLTEGVLGVQQPLLSQLDSMEGLRAWRDHLVGMKRKVGGRGGCPIGSLGSELSESDDEARVAVAEGFARWEGAIRDGLRAMHRRGELRADADPDALALGTLSALQGGLLLSQIRQDTAALEAGLDAMLDHIASFLATREDGR